MEPKVNLKEGELSSGARRRRAGSGALPGCDSQREGEGSLPAGFDEVGQLHDAGVFDRYNITNEAGLIHAVKKFTTAAKRQGRGKDRSSWQGISSLQVLENCWFHSRAGVAKLEDARLKKARVGFRRTRRA
jgi:hypothetical protein